jgi:hypothetical protein
MTESNDNSPTQPVPTAPLTPLTPASLPTAQEPGPITAPEPGIAFHERVTPGRGRSTATWIGRDHRIRPARPAHRRRRAMGASPAPSSRPDIGRRR